MSKREESFRIISKNQTVLNKSGPIYLENTSKVTDINNSGTNVFVTKDEGTPDVYYVYSLGSNPIVVNMTKDELSDELRNKFVI